MPRRNHDAAVAARRSEVARLYCEGWPQARIAAKFGCTFQNISYDLKCIRREWRRVMVEEYDRIKDEQLAKLDAAEYQAWRGWRRSLRPAEKVTAKRDFLPPVQVAGGQSDQQSGEQPARPDPTAIGPVEETRVIEGQAGDPRFLQIVIDCVEKRCKLIGAYPDPRDKEPGGTAELVIRVLGSRTTMSDLCGGRMLGAHHANAAGEG